MANLELARWALKQTLASGAKEAKVHVAKSRSVSIKFRDGKLDELKESIESSLSVSVYAAGRYSVHSTNDLRKESLAGYIKDAVSMTKLLNADPFRSLPDPKYYKGRKDVDLELLDPAYESVRSEQRVALAKEIQRIGSGKSPKIVSCTGSCYDGSSESVKVHSNGFEGTRASTYFGMGSSVSVDDGKGGRPEGGSWAGVRSRTKLPDPETVGAEGAQRALRKIGQKKAKSGAYDMVVENRAAGRLLSSLYRAMTGRSLQQRASFLEGKLGERIASRHLTMLDDPFLPAGLGSKLYDGDGMSTERRVIIKKGKLKTFYVDDYYGKKLKMKPTTGGTSNIVLKGGSGTQEELLKRMGKGIFITGFLGGNSNATTGDYSFGISGMLIEDGKFVRPVNEMNISGNLIDLWKNLAAVGDDPYPYSSWRLPSLYFKKIQFSGV